MTTELASVRTLSTQLTKLFSEINSTFGRGKQLVVKAYNLALQEGYTPQEAKDLVLDKVTAFSKRTIYYALPDECKLTTGPKRGITSDKIATLQSSDSEQEFNTKDMGVVITDDSTSSGSESTTGPDGEEKEQEVEQAYTPPIDQTPYHELQKEREQFAQRFGALQMEYDTIVRDKDKALEEVRAENTKLRAANPTGELNPDVMKNLGETIEKQADKIREQEEVIRKQTQTFTKARDIPVTNQTLSEVTLSKAQKIFLLSDLMHTDCDVKFYLYNSELVDWEPTEKQSLSDSEERRERRLRRESLQNVTQTKQE